MQDCRSSTTRAPSRCSSRTSSRRAPASPATAARRRYAPPRIPSTLTAWDKQDPRDGKQLDIIQDAISEVAILTNNFKAEFGTGAGGQFNTVTKSGTNEFHGSGFCICKIKTSTPPAPPKRPARARRHLEKPASKSALRRHARRPARQQQTLLLRGLERDHSPRGRGVSYNAPTAAGLEQIAALPGASPSSLISQKQSDARHDRDRDGNRARRRGIRSGRYQSSPRATSRRRSTSSTLTTSGGPKISFVSAIHRTTRRSSSPAAATPSSTTQRPSRSNSFPPAGFASSTEAWSTSCAFPTSA